MYVFVLLAKCGNFIFRRISLAVNLKCYAYKLTGNLQMNGIVLVFCILECFVGARAFTVASKSLSRMHSPDISLGTGLKLLDLKSAAIEAPTEVWGWDDTFSTTFITNYLQRRPLVIRNAFPNIVETVPLQFDDYVNLASDEDVCARIYKLKGKKVIKEYGPFERSTFDTLKPSSKWSLLIQEVDRHIPQVADIWHEHFSFMPNWRRDDIMISYSIPGGSIGAHVDNYDVFLVQGSGTRRWSIENKFLSESEEKRREVAGSDTRLLRDFSADLSWELNPGDLLYLPPRIPHHGITTGSAPSTTISVGFRAPNYKSLITALWEDISTHAISEDEVFYRDGADLQAPPRSPGLIAEEACVSMRKVVTETLMGKLGDSAYFNCWLGKHLTTPLRYHQCEPRAFFLAHNSRSKHTANVSANGDEEEVEEDAEEGSEELPYAVRSTNKHRVAQETVYADAHALLQAVAAGECALRRAEGLRVAYIGDTLFIDGEMFPASQELGAILCDNNIIFSERVPQHAGLLVELIERGYFYPVSTDWVKH